MHQDLIQEYVRCLIVERAKDVDFLKISKQAFDDVVSFLKNMQGKSQSEFDSFFEKENGRYTKINLKDVSSIPELDNISLVIKDRATFDVRKGLKALSSFEMKRIHRAGGGYRRKYRISIFIDLDRSQNWSAYNKKFRDSVYDKFSFGDNWEHFSHELTHILDFQRQEDEYLFYRREKVAKRKAEREKDEEAYLNAYANDPSESNAYIRQSLIRVQQMVQNAQTQDEIIQILGNNQKEFLDKFMNEYLVKIAKKRFNDDNRLRAIKRAMSFYDHIVDEYLK